jgi:hypothetical protein
MMKQILEQEIWKDIPWYEWLYQASNIWNVRSIKFNKIKILKNWIKWNTKYIIWYKSYSLCKLWKIRQFLWHRLVAQTFLWLNINDDKMFVCHKDDNPLNNTVENLFLWTHQDNMDDMVNKWRNWCLWKFWKLHHNSKKTNQYTIEWELIKKWDSLKDVERTLWIKAGSISNVCIWRRKTAWWFIWKYFLT